MNEENKLDNIPEDLKAACSFLINNPELDLPGAIYKIQRIGFVVPEIVEFERSIATLKKYFKD